MDHPFPTIAADDQAGGFVYVAWHDYRSSNTDGIDILVSKSINSGTTWESPRKVNTDTLPPNDIDGKRNDQFYPTMSVSWGIIGVAFYDRRLDPNNSRVDLYLAYSTDNGYSFTETGVSDVSSDPTIQTSSWTYGEDYITLFSKPTPGSPAGSLVQIVWTDTRNPPDPDPDTVPANQDVWTERLTLTLPSGGGGSVAAGSLITVADGSKVEVQDLRVGDRILSYDTETGETVVTTITRIERVQVDNRVVLRLADGTRIRTDNNPAQEFWVKKQNGIIGFVGVPDIQPGDYLFHVPTESWTRLEAKRLIEGETFIVYDIYTTAPYNYIVNDYLDPQKM